MAKYKVLKSFVPKGEVKSVKQESEIEISVDRAEAINTKHKSLGVILERVKEKQEAPTKKATTKK